MESKLGGWEVHPISLEENSGQAHASFFSEILVNSQEWMLELVTNYSSLAK
jgi:hypothetical protein